MQVVVPFFVVFVRMMVLHNLVVFVENVVFEGQVELVQEQNAVPLLFESYYLVVVLVGK